MVTIMNFLAIVFHSILFLMRERGNSELTPCVYLLYFMNLEDDEYFFYESSEDDDICNR